MSRSIRSESPGAQPSARPRSRRFTADGRLVVPLQVRGQQRSIAFERADGYWRSRSIELCSFVPMQGARAYARRTVVLNESVEWMDLWLGCTMDGFCRMNVQPRAVERGLVTPALRWGSSAVFDGDTFAYLTLRPNNRTEDPDNTQGITRTVYEFGVCAHGPGSAELAGRVADQIRTWDRDHRSGTGPRIEVSTSVDTTRTGYTGRPAR